MFSCYGTHASRHEKKNALLTRVLELWSYVCYESGYDEMSGLDRAFHV